MAYSFIRLCILSTAFFSNDCSRIQVFLLLFNNLTRNYCTCSFQPIPRYSRTELELKFLTLKTNTKNKYILNKCILMQNKTLWFENYISPKTRCFSSFTNSFIDSLFFFIHKIILSFDNRSILKRLHSKHFYVQN